MKNAKRILVVLVVVLLASSLGVGMTACNRHKVDNDSTAFAMSIQNPDGVFNPFFSTSAYDSSIISLTQISMLTTDKVGNLITGLEHPTVALDYKVTPVIVDGSDPTGPAETAPNEEDATHTDYEFVIKNGIKFSDGTDLTIKDVLFNLYVYLDPVFTGSATIYSTDIVGLNAYRTQTASIDEAGMSGFEERFVASAQVRLTDLIAWVNKYTGQADEDNTNANPIWPDNSDAWSGSFEYDSQQSISQEPLKVTFADLRKQVGRVAAIYMDELRSDWNAINMEDYTKLDDKGNPTWEGFTEPWQIFMLNDMGYASNTDFLKYLDGGTRLDKTEAGNPKLQVAFAREEYEQIIANYSDQNIANMPEGNDEEKLAKQNAIRDAFVRAQFEAVFGSEYSYNSADSTYTVQVPNISRTMFNEVLSYWGTAATYFDELTANAKSDYFKEQMSGQGLSFPNIRGIWVSKETTFNGKSLNGTHYVLHIRINEIDPKALMNFSFTVAPMNYYSNPTQVELVNRDWKNWEDNGAVPEQFNNYVTHFGLEYASSDFMNNEINAATKIVKPIGAGSYQPSNAGGESDVTKVTGSGSSGFFNNNMVYYTRNQNFWTVGADGRSESESQLHNAKIKTVVYKVVASDQIINSLKSGEIHFGDPSATNKNEIELTQAGLTVVKTPTAGYGYIGINPRYVPELEVRIAIMKAMNIQDDMIEGYYENGFASRLYRPMSKTSWVWDYNYSADEENNPATTDYSWSFQALNGRYIDVTYEYDNTGTEIERLVEAAGYEKNSSGLYQKGTKTLDFKFTIAGGNTDHPAYNCFLHAQKLLNDHGFNVQVVTSAQALSDLSAGKLAVWAAAWSSAIDPDMYQVYHINSQASSVNNWGYKQIKADQSTYNREYQTISNLSERIDAAREITDQANRASIYFECLDLVMELACELPTYQRNDIAAYNAKVIDANSLPKHGNTDPNKNEVSPYYGLLSRIWEISFVQ